jgi:CRP-like cAMP-binding protein
VAEATAFADAHHCGAQAAAGSEHLALPAATFPSTIAEDPDVAPDWVAKRAHGLHAARRRAEIRTIRSVIGRLDAWLETGGAIPAREAGRTSPPRFALTATRLIASVRHPALDLPSGGTLTCCANRLKLSRW